MTFRANHSNESHLWQGASVRKICLCYPSAARQLVLDYGCMSGPLSRVFDVPKSSIQVRYGAELLLTVYTGDEGTKGKSDDEAALWGLRWTKTLWAKYQAVAEAEATKTVEGGGE